MQHQFKAGDLALIIRSRKTPENVGRTVEIVEIETPSYDKWPVKVSAEGLIVYMDDDPTPRISNHAWMNPRDLMPLKGDQSPTQTNTETPKEVVHG